MHRGWVRMYRCIFDSTWSCNPEYVSLWVFCLTKANHKESKIVTKGGNIIKLNPGQFMTSRQQISAATGIQESKIERILKVFKSEQQIEQVSSGKWRVITITNWIKYQQCEQVFEQQTNNKRTTSEQQMNTDKNDKNDKNDKELKSSPDIPPKPEIETANIFENLYGDDDVMNLKEFAQTYTETFGTFMPGGLNQVASEVCKKHPRSTIKFAFGSAAAAGATHFNYVRKCLENDGDAVLDAVFGPATGGKTQ